MKNPIGTHEEKCVGCHRCIPVCPVNANKEDISLHGPVTILKSLIQIDDNRCIQCGECFKVCTHNARYYTDDTDSFFEDLELKKNKMAVITAPAFLYNFENYKHIIGWLKHLGVEIIQDVSFGADITTYTYLKLYENTAEKEQKTYISQPCPVVVHYIEKYAPHLIKNLAPCQSPVMCSAIWLRKYEKFDGKIAFISPCIAKRTEFENDNNSDYINYNITITKLKEYIDANQIELKQFPEAEFDNMQSNLGYNYSRPGGLREQIEYYSKDELWVKQIEGVKHTAQYIERYSDRIKNKKPAPQLVDILNCMNGCNQGTGTNRDVLTDDVDYIINARKKQFIKQEKENQNPCDNSLFKMFNEKLDMNDFIRKYTAKPVTTREVNKKSPNYIEKLEKIFISLGKHTEEQRTHNCNACGRGCCYAFADAVISGVAMVSSCFFYSHELLHEMLTSLRTDKRKN